MHSMKRARVPLTFHFKEVQKSIVFNREYGSETKFNSHNLQSGEIAEQFDRFLLIIKFANGKFPIQS